MKRKLCILNVATQYPVLGYSDVGLYTNSSFTSIIAFCIFTSSLVILLFKTVLKYEHL